MGSFRAHSALLVTIVLWAVAFPAIRVGVAGWGPAALSILRLAIASLVLGLVAPALGVRRPARKDLPLILLAGLTGMAGYQLLLNWGEVRVPAGTASLIVVTNPIYSAIAAVLFLGERLSGRRIAGGIVALAGTATIATARGGLSVDRAAWIILAAAVAFGVYHVAIKPLLSRYTGLEVTAYATWTGTLLLLPAIPALVHAIPDATLKSTWAVIFLGLAPSALGFVTWAYAVARLPVTVATGSLYLAPPIAVLVGYVWLHETPRLTELVGGVIAIGGVVIANSRPRTSTVPAVEAADAKA
jgi:drug/metabolite transporter (DMT)-like permease